MHVGDLIYSTDRVTGKADPKFPRGAKIISACKYIVDVGVTRNIASRGPKDAFATWYISKKFGEYERRTGESVVKINKPNGYIWKRIANQVRDVSLEWPPMGEVSKHDGFCKKEVWRWVLRENGRIRNIRTLKKTAGAPESISPDPDKFARRKLTCFLKRRKIRETIYCKERLIGRKKIHSSEQHDVLRWMGRVNRRGRQTDVDHL